jgi:hypothetical protein
MLCIDSCGDFDLEPVDWEEHEAKQRREQRKARFRMGSL